ncbi:hypothetical protein DPMN_095462 [Dreissena polymorpha]|uniref:Uncharacterized protein n=1 Tax=Dreissena polymorpha TaxID=45954 RepID=A0A9D4L9H6_DREPO|nr:hypothetical protein DPMN_095462 [Dreissena polymorpha]
MFLLTRKTALPPGGHTNVKTKFHEDWTINVTSRVLTSFHEDQTKNVVSRMTHNRQQHFQDMALDTKVTDGQLDNAKTISLCLWRDIYTHTKFQLNPPKHFQDMASDTKVPIHFQDMAPDTKVPDGRTDSQTDGQRQNNIPPPLAGDNKICLHPKTYAPKERFFET